MLRGCAASLDAPPGPLRDLRSRRFGTLRPAVGLVTTQDTRRGAAAYFGANPREGGGRVMVLALTRNDIALLEFAVNDDPTGEPSLGGPASGPGQPLGGGFHQAWWALRKAPRPGRGERPKPRWGRAGSDKPGQQVEQTNAKEREP